jgi:hypothetical protein
MSMAWAHSTLQSTWSACVRSFQFLASICARVKTSYIWVNYNISQTWIKAIWGWFPLLIMNPVRSQRGRYNLPRYMIDARAFHNGNPHNGYVNPSFMDSASPNRKQPVLWQWHICYDVYIVGPGSTPTPRVSSNDSRCWHVQDGWPKPEKNTLAFHIKIVGNYGS